MHQGGGNYPGQGQRDMLCVVGLVLPTLNVHVWVKMHQGGGNTPNRGQQDMSVIGTGIIQTESAC